MQNTTLATGLTIQQPEQQDPKLALPTDYVLQLLTVYYDAIVGSPAQVSAGFATHASINLALAAVPQYGTLLVLRGAYNETVTLNAPITIYGQGYGTFLTGNFTFNSNYCHVENMNFVAGNIQFSPSSNQNFLKSSWLNGAYTLTDLGTANIFEVLT